MAKKPKDFLYSYLIYIERELIASYFSDAAPPSLGATLEIDEFLEPPVAAMSLYKVEKIRLYPIPKESRKHRFSVQTRVHITVTRI